MGAFGLLGEGERRLERSDSKSITPSSHITNSLPLVASLLILLITAAAGTWIAVEADDPDRGNAPDDPPSSSSTTSQSSSSPPSSAIMQLLSSPLPSTIFLASFLRFCAGLTIGVWGATYFKESFPTSSSLYAVLNALVVSVCGGVSGIGGGVLADEINKKGYSRLLVPVAGSVLGAITFAGVMHAATFNAAMAWLAASYLGAECWFGPTISVLQSSVPAERGGTAQGLFTLTGAVANLAPAVLGGVLGMKGLGLELGGILEWAVVTFYLGSAIFFGKAILDEEKMQDSKGD